MKKSIKEAKMKELGEELIKQNKILYLAKDNETRMLAAQRAYVKLGMLLGLADFDYWNPVLSDIREKQIAQFGNWAIIKDNTSFGCVDDEKLTEIAKEHKKEMNDM